MEHPPGRGTWSRPGTRRRLACSPWWTRPRRPTSRSATSWSVSGRTLPSVVVGTLAQLAQLPAVDLSEFTPQPDATAAMPAEVADEFGAIGLQIDGHALVVAFAEPPEPAEIDELAGRVGHRVHPVLADPVVIARHLGTDASAGSRRGARRASRPNRGGGRAPEPGHRGGSQGRLGAAPRRRPPALRGVRRRLRPPPHRGHARDDPPPRRPAADRGMPATRQRDHPGHGLRDPARHRSASGSRRRRSSTPRTPSPASAGSV